MKNIFRKLLYGLLKVLFMVFVLSLLWVFSYKFINPPLSGMMLHNWWNTENYSIDYQWKDLENINSSIPLAFISSEDQNFLMHNGFDVEAIKGAIKHNKGSKRKRGASTISQQVAKNVFLIPTKTYFRKGLEVYFTGLIELMWGKRRIMEVYCNVVEMGSGIYGAEAASKKFFNIPASKISRTQAALLATALPNPLKFKLNAPGAYQLSRRQWVLRQMNNLGGEQLLLNWYE